jgi:hypothetical protein
LFVPLCVCVQVPLKLTVSVLSVLCCWLVRVIVTSVPLRHICLVS